MALLDDMAKGIKEYKKAFADLNNNNDSTRQDIYNALIMQAHRNLGQLLERYERGER